jgi:hypothetical protein
MKYRARYEIFATMLEVASSEEMLPGQK